jgi:hypothetical protein
LQLWFEPKDFIVDVHDSIVGSLHPSLRHLGVKVND